jgi:hypothetical protein
MAEGTIGGLTDMNVMRVGIYMEGQQQRFQTGFHLRSQTPATGDPEDAVGEVRDWVDNSFRAMVPNDYRVVAIDAINIVSKEYSRHEYIDVFGTLGGASTYTALAALVSLRSNQRARHRNGRMFWPAYAVQGNSQFQVNYLQGFSSCAAAFASRWVGVQLTGGFRAVIVAKARPLTPHRPAIQHSWIDVETVKVSPFATALRRRKVGVGS